MPDLGIAEGLTALFGGGADLLGGLFGGGAAAAEAGAGAAGLDAAAATAAGTGLASLPADIAGTGAALAGGETGLAGTLAAGGSGLGIADLAGGTAGLGALGTATDFLGGGGAATGGAGFGTAADVAATQAAQSGLASGITPGIGTPGGGAGILGAGGNFTPSGAGGTSVFDTGTSGVPGVNAGGAPAATPSIAPAGASASSIAAPAGVTAPADATSLGTVPGATGPTSLGGAPLQQPSSPIADLLDKAGSGAMKSLTSNPLGILLGAGGLGYNIYAGQQATKNQTALTADAQAATANSNQMVQSGEALQQYLTNGTLPPAYQTQVDQAIQDAKTSAISNAAQQGLNTDPTQNTALAASLAKIDASRAGMQVQVAQTLFSSGSSLVSAGQSAAGLSGQLYSTLVQNDTAAAANTGKAIATLAAALNGKASNTIGNTTLTASAA